MGGDSASRVGMLVATVVSIQQDSRRVGLAVNRVKVGGLLDHGSGVH